MESISPADAVFQAYQAGRFADAAEQAERLLGDTPDDWRLLSLHGACRQALGDDAAAALSFRSALAVRPDIGKLHNSLGAANLRLGRLAEASAAFQRAVELDPNLAAAHFNLGLIADNAGRANVAIAHFRRALVAEPNHVEALVALGGTLRRERRYAEAQRQLLEALALSPAHLVAWSRLLGLLERRNRHQELRQMVDRARSELGDVPLVRLYEGLLAELAKDMSEARRLFESCGFDSRHAEGEHLEQLRLTRLARVCDRLDDPSRAMHWAEAANAISRDIGERAGLRRAQFIRAVERRRAVADELAHTLQSRAATGAGPGQGLVFMVGFPRSGTTLLDSMLRGHPDICLVEESEAVARLVNSLAGSGDEKLETLAHVPEAALAEARRSYFAALREAGSATKPLVIDRLPLNLIYAGEIHRAFPSARFLLALRHPADCVLSCFLQSFAPSPANESFHSLADAAELYAVVFQTWQRLRDALDLDVIEVRYEALIEAPVLTCKALLEALGMDWHPGVLEHSVTAGRRDVVETASYDQVVRPLYTEAVGRWRRYRAHLEPVWSHLNPWIVRLGYED